MGKKKSNNKGELPYRLCAGIVVLNQDNKVWAGRRIAPDGGELSMTDKLWQMPQGGIDKGEDPQAAAKRELWEETGMTSVSYLAKASQWIDYDLPEALLGTALKGKYKGQRMAWYAFRFEGDESEINISNPPDGAPVEFDAWDWVEMADLPEMIVSFKRDVYLKVVSEFSHLIG